MRRILVTGGSGFMGSHLVDRLAQDAENHVTVFDLYPRIYDSLPPNVTFIQGDLGDNSLVRRTIIDHGVQVIYHLAWADIHETSIKDPIKDIELNLLSTVSLLETCRDTKVKRIVFVSSGGTVYGIPKNLPVTEDHPTHPISAYGITKLATEKYIRMYSYLYGLDYVILRPSVPYGPRQNPRRRQGAVSVFLYQTLTNRPISIWGDGKIVRDFFYIDDLIEALVAAIKLPVPSGEIFNLAGSEAYSLIDLVKKIESALDREVEINYEPPRQFDVPNLQLDTGHAKSKLNWVPDVDLNEGILRTAEWLKMWIDWQNE